MLKTFLQLVDTTSIWHVNLTFTVILYFTIKILNWSFLYINVVYHCRKTEWLHGAKQPLLYYQT